MATEIILFFWTLQASVWTENKVLPFDQPLAIPLNLYPIPPASYPSCPHPLPLSLFPYIYPYFLTTFISLSNPSPLTPYPLFYISHTVTLYSLPLS